MADGFKCLSSHNHWVPHGERFKSLQVIRDMEKQLPAVSNSGVFFGDGNDDADLGFFLHLIPPFVMGRPGAVYDTLRLGGVFKAPYLLLFVYTSCTFQHNPLCDVLLPTSSYLRTHAQYGCGFLLNEIFCRQIPGPRFRLKAVRKMSRDRCPVFCLL